MFLIVGIHLKRRGLKLKYKIVFFNNETKTRHKTTKICSIFGQNKKEL